MWIEVPGMIRIGIGWLRRYRNRPTQNAVMMIVKMTSSFGRVSSDARPPMMSASGPATTSPNRRMVRPKATMQRAAKADPDGEPARQHRRPHRAQRPLRQVADEINREQR